MVNVYPLFVEPVPRAAPRRALLALPAVRWRSAASSATRSTARSSISPRVSPALPADGRLRGAGGRDGAFHSAWSGEAASGLILIVNRAGRLRVKFSWITTVT